MISLNLLPDVKKQLLRAKKERNVVIFSSIVAMIGSGVLLVVLGIIMGGQAIHKATMEGSIKKSEGTIAKDKEDKQLDKYLTVQNQLKQIDGLKSGQMLYSRVFEYAMQLNPAAPNNILIKSMTISDGSTSGSADVTSGNGSITIDGKTASFASLDVFRTTALKAKIVYTPDDGSDATDDSVDPTTDANSVDGSSTNSNSSSDTSSDSATDSSTTSNSDGASQDNNSSSDNNSKTKEIKENLFSKVTIVSQTLQNDTNGSYVNFTITMEYNQNAFLQTSKNIRLEIPKETTSDADQNAPKTEELFTKNDSKDNKNEEGSK